MHTRLHDLPASLSAACKLAGAGARGMGLVFCFVLFYGAACINGYLLIKYAQRRRLCPVAIKCEFGFLTSFAGLMIVSLHAWFEQRIMH